MRGNSVVSSVCCTIFVDLIVWLVLYIFGDILEDELEAKFATVTNRSGGLYHLELLLNKIQNYCNADRCQCAQRKFLGALHSL